MAWSTRTGRRAPRVLVAAVMTWEVASHSRRCQYLKMPRSLGPGTRSNSGTSEHPRLSPGRPVGRAGVYSGTSELAWGQCSHPFTGAAHPADPQRVRAADPEPGARGQLDDPHPAPVERRRDVAEATSHRSQFISPSRNQRCNGTLHGESPVRV